MTAGFLLRCACGIKDANPGSVLTSVDIDAVALASLRHGPNTDACRHCKGEKLDLLTLARRLELPEGEIPDRIRDARRWAEAAVATAARSGLELIASRTPAYPERLWEIDDPPIVLWSKGAASIPSRTVAIVGSRRSTPAGLIVARKLGADLASAGWTVVSGMALGVDGAAHEGALEAGGETIAVLGCGADIVYPREHRMLAARIAERGRILSEFSPGAPLSLGISRSETASSVVWRVRSSWLKQEKRAARSSRPGWRPNREGTSSQSPGVRRRGDIKVATAC